MRRQKLAVEQSPSPRRQPGNQMRQCNLGCIAHPADHGFPEKDTAQRYTVQPADQLAVLPAFDAMGMAQREQTIITVADYRVDPGCGAIPGGFGAQCNNGRKIPVGRDAKPILNQCLA